MSGRAIARAAGINHQACAVALRSLESLGLLERQGAGRIQLIRLNFDNYLLKTLVLPLLQKERQLLVNVRRDIVRTFQNQATTITLFGSVARGQDVPGSDVDVLILAEGSDKSRILSKASRYSAEFQERHGLRLSPLVMTPGEARRKAKGSNGLLKNILADGLDLLPRKLHEVLA
jgi:predicted nucleotidyltransferase